MREETWLSMLAYMERLMGATDTPAKLGTCLSPAANGGKASTTSMLCSNTDVQHMQDTLGIGAACEGASHVKRCPTEALMMCWLVQLQISF